MTISMADLLQKAGVAPRKYLGEFGVEIETEAKTPYTVPAFAFWDTKGDGSLRDFGIEYVLKQPLGFDKELPEALKEFAEKTKDFKFTKDSITTSVHVHVNMLNESPATFCNFLTSYTLVENLLVRYAGENRRSNGFSLPIIDAEETYRSMRDMIVSIGGKDYRQLVRHPDHCKYAGINLSALGRFGSLEIRLFRGETDIEKINTWVRILNRILVYSRGNIIPPDIILAYKNKEEKILEDIFKTDTSLIAHKEQKQLLEDNFWFAGNLAFATPDWKKLLNEKKPAKILAKEMDKYANKLYGAVFERLTARQQHDLVNAVRNGHFAEAGRVQHDGDMLFNNRAAEQWNRPVAARIPVDDVVELEDDF